MYSERSISLNRLQFPLRRPLKSPLRNSSYLSTTFTPPYYFPSHFKNIVAADSYLFKDRIQRGRVKYLYNIVSSLCEPMVVQTRSEALSEQMLLRVSSVDEMGTSPTDVPHFSEGRMPHILRSKIRIRKSHNVSASMSPVMQSAHLALKGQRHILTTCASELSIR